MTNQPAAAAAGRAANASAILLIVCVATFFGVLNASAVGVILPDIAADLSVDAAQLGWLMTGFLLVYGIAIPLYGRLADLYGARPLFLIGVAIFSAGSLLSALASDFSFLLAARIIQAAGGAAVPGLGMTLASRAYGLHARGTVLGVIAATIGGGSAIGPLLGGALSGAFGWQSIFYLTAAAAVTIPIGMRLFPRNEVRAGGSLDLFGWVALAFLVSGALLVPSEGARSGWASPLALTGVIIAIVGLISLSVRQLTADSPMIPRELLRNFRYDALVGTSFFVMAANLPPLIGLPILLATFHNLSPLEVGLAMVPGAIASSVFGVVAGRLSDRKGARLPIWLGSPLLLISVLGLSIYAGSSAPAVAAFAGLLGAGFGLVNTPLAATVSRIVRGQILASALSINSMLFFLGGGFGTAVLMAVVTLRSGTRTISLNPLHSGVAAGFSDGFLILAIPVLAAMLLSLALPHVSPPASVERQEPDQPERSRTKNWVPNCSVPWSPDCVEVQPPNPDPVESTGSSHNPDS